jgi:hypothetical protein
MELRQILLEALERFSRPTGHGELRAYAGVFHGLDVTTGDLAALQDNERDAYQAGEQRQVWVCPAIVRLYPDFLPDASLLTRSDWPLAQRIELEESSAVRQLWLTRQLAAGAASTPSARGWASTTALSPRRRRNSRT